MNQRPALPYPTQALRDRQYLSASPRGTKTKLHDRLQQEHHDLQYKMELLEARLDAVSTWQPESKTARPQANPLPSPAALSAIQPSVGQLCWTSDLANNYNQLGDSAGNTSGVAWCNGIFLSDGLFLTVGHCFDKSGGWQRPNHYGVVPPAKFIAPLFNVCFTSSETTRDTNGTWFQIEELLHHRPWGLNCAIVRLSQGQGADGKTQLPTPLIQFLALEDDDLKLTDADVYLVDLQPSQNTHDSIQQGLHKVQITEHQHTGIIFSSANGENTLSGTPLITEDGDIVAIKVSHTEALDIRSIHQLLELDNDTIPNHLKRDAKCDR